MTALPSKFQPIQGGVSVSQPIPRRRRVQFGDGYVQTSLASINPNIPKVTVNYLIWGDDDLNEFLDFFNTLGAANLTFTLPNETTPHDYEVENVNIDYVDAMQRNASLQIQRVY